MPERFLEIFYGIPWSTNRVLNLTLEKLQLYRKNVLITHKLKRHEEVSNLEPCKVPE